jgi:carboxyl-terminal processing protease
VASFSSAKKVGLLGAGALAGVLVSVGVTAVAQRAGRLPMGEVQQLSDVFNLVKTYYVEPVEDKKLLQDALSGMMQGLDPHSTYLNAESYKEMREGIKGEFAGLGIEVGTEDGFVKVIAPIDDTPASRAGVRAGDLIVRIDDKPTKGLPLNDAVKLMRGPLNSAVTLTISRKGDNVPVVVRLNRAMITMQSIRAKMVEPGIAHIRLTIFNDNTIKGLADAMERMNKQAPLKGVILDMRNDPGGILEGAIGVSAAFLPPRTLVTSTDGQIREAKRQFYSNPETYTRRGDPDPFKNLPAVAKTVPLVVLVNQGSASASEIVAGALQDHKRATLMGTQTFGKGSVQTILPIDENRTEAIKITTARYFTPSGRSIQAKGIVPDYLVDETPDGDPLAELRTREADLDRHLGADKDNKDAPKAALTQEQIAEKAAAEKAAIERLRNRKPLEPGGAEDHQFLQAMNFLKGKPVMTAKPKSGLAQSTVPANPVAPAK